MADQRYDELTAKTVIPDGSKILLGAENGELFQVSVEQIIRKALENDLEGTIYKRNASGDLVASAMFETNESIQIEKVIETRQSQFSLEQLVLKAYGPGLIIVSNASGKKYDTVYNERGEINPFIATVDLANLENTSIQPIEDFTVEMILPVTFQITTTAAREFLNVAFKSKGNIDNFRIKVHSISAGTDAFFYPNKLSYTKNQGVDLTGAGTIEIFDRLVAFEDDSVGSTPARLDEALTFEITIEGENPEGGSAIVMGDGVLPYAIFTTAALSFRPIQIIPDMTDIRNTLDRGFTSLPTPATDENISFAANWEGVRDIEIVVEGVVVATFNGLASGFSSLKYTISIVNWSAIGSASTQPTVSYEIRDITNLLDIKILRTYGFRKDL